MRKQSPDLNWLPPQEEWDFRSVESQECWVACHWEYARQIRSAMPPHKGGGVSLPANTSARGSYCPAIYRQAARSLFPQAWIALTSEERGKILDAFFAIPALRIRKLGDFLNRMQGASPEIQRAYGEHGYFMQSNFALHGVEAVIKEFEVWARKEAKQHRQAPRAKAAEPPFDGLKWLAVLRLEGARRQAGINFASAKETLEAYRRIHPQTGTHDVFPIYTSHGAWSKAIADALRLQSKVLTDSSNLLAGLS